MSLLAANLLGLVLTCGHQGLGTDVSYVHSGIFQSARIAPNAADPAYLSMLPNVVKLFEHDQPIGIAVLIDSSGLYLAPKNSINTEEEIEGHFPNGQTGHLRRLNTDSLTGLALLKSDYVPPNARPVSVIPADPNPGTLLVVMMDSGSVRGRLDSTEKIGIAKVTGRLVPLSEVRFETPTSTLSGALVFTTSGVFVGAINATLAKLPAGAADFRAQFSTKLSNQAVPVGGLGGGGAAGNGQIADSLGPADMTVAYTPGVDVLRRVVEGFLSPSHIVAYASLGVFCRNGAGGALITQVVAESPADKIGMQAGDMIVSMGLYMVRSQIDFAKIMNKARPGEQTFIRFDRGGRVYMKGVTFGRILD